MAAPTAVAQNPVTVSGGTGTGTTLDTNAASRQLVMIENQASEYLTVILSTGAAPSITPGTGFVIYPGSSEWFWMGTGIRAYGRMETASGVVNVVELS
jgi:hypothetical protein